MSAHIAQNILYLMAKSLYATEVAHSAQMKQSLTSIDAYDRFRSEESSRVIAALDHHGVPIAGKVVMDFGCNDGAISSAYLQEGAARVIGADIDSKALARARHLHPDERLSFILSDVDHVPVESNSIDVLVSLDVFEHVAKPLPILREIHRVLVPGGHAVIGTIGWRMPFAPHLWSVMPVPWAHVLFSERTLLRACRRVYRSSWYVPNMHDYDASGKRLQDKYTHEAIPTDYLNKYLIRDFERIFRDLGFGCSTDIVLIGGSRWLRPLVRVPWLREFVGSSAWFVLTKPIDGTAS
jgi:2-polyprenyl-3-methyl-5-hydroxy-6-metoxy-1,4-benzoquinol methylase